MSLEKSEYVSTGRENKILKGEINYVVKWCS
nr:MAG TPA: hypothetical protein [Caudoviricetes sp.]